LAGDPWGEFGNDPSKASIYWKSGLAILWKQLMNHDGGKLYEFVVNLRIEVINVNNNIAISWKQLSYILKTTFVYYQNNLAIIIAAT
jgi:hypothetical protein